MPRSFEQNVTWKDVDRVRQANPEWTYPQIAGALNTGAAYVRATFKRRKWVGIPAHVRIRDGSGHGGARIGGQL